MAICGLILIAIVISWVPALGLPLGDDHQGRILGRMALHADNFVARGWSGSNYISDWMPYANVPYAHHPPMQQFMHAGLAWIIDGASSLGVRTLESVGGLLSAGVLIGFVRKLSGSWVAAAFAATGLAVSGYFWLFGRNWSLLFVVAFFLTHLSDRLKPTRFTNSAILVVAAVATLHSWQAALTIGLLGVFDFIHGDRRRTLIAFGGLAVGLGLDFLWIESAAGLGALAGHIGGRIAAANYGTLDWLARQLGFLARFENVPTVLAMAVGVVFGLRDANYRPYMLSSLLSVLLFATIFNQNAWVHEYWNWRGALVITVGMASLGTCFMSMPPLAWARWSVAALAILSASVPLLRLAGDLYASQYTESSAAGALAERTEWPESQSIALHYGGLSSPRWLSWYSDLPVRHFDHRDPARVEDLVMVKLQEDDVLVGVEMIDSLGSYAIANGNVLADAASARQ